ncbi:hypothetical protein DQW50_00115 [Halorubrum sp. 48-1-W]|uniref:hypothetical protein n=1 Tax=Halorubrum sp. 48-1-W TaxID=2249761 RepID=UPI000DCCBF7C|nr:hypothetical protein [Halorubrum sp. 48-1-W]RAW46841.1 hypothetical protein DQW50_00115 [Halorubrum sp. 48-1-W]
MGLLTTLREWVGGLLGGSAEADDEADEADEGTAGSESTKPTGPDDDRLDPGAVTETRSTANDDAVDKLREIQQTAPGAESDDETDPVGSGADDGTDSTESGADDGKR